MKYIKAYEIKKRLDIIAVVTMVFCFIFGIVLGWVIIDNSCKRIILGIFAMFGIWLLGIIIALTLHGKGYSVISRANIWSKMDQIEKTIKQLMLRL